MASSHRDTPVVAIVEDDGPLRSAIGNLLRAAGYDVAAFEGPEEFLANAAPGRYDVILSDYRMPGGSGADLARSVRSIGCTAPVIIMTAHSSGEVELDALAAGVQSCLQKPFGDTELLIEIEKALLSRGS